MSGRFREGGIMRGPGVRVVSAEMDPTYDPPSASMNPDATARPWRHPLFQQSAVIGPDEYVICPELGKPPGEWTRVSTGCRHLEPVPVESVLGELVAWLCPECDAQLPAEWRTV